MLGASVAPQIAAPPMAHHRPEQQFALVESGGGLGLNVENTTVFSAIDHGGTTTWFVERNNNEDNFCGRSGNGQCIPTHTTSMDWIDGRTCAPLREVLIQLETVRTNERDSAHGWVSDTPLLSLLMFKRGSWQRSGSLNTWGRLSIGGDRLRSN